MALVALPPAEILFIPLLIIGTWPQRIVASVLGVAVGGLVVRRAFRIELVVNDEKIVIKNFWRQRTIRWHELATITWGYLAVGVMPWPVVAFETHSAKWRFPAQATQTMGKKKRIEVVKVLAAYAEAHQVTFHLCEQDLKP